MVQQASGSEPAFQALRSLHGREGGVVSAPLWSNKGTAVSRRVAGVNFRGPGPGGEAGKLENDAGGGRGRSRKVAPSLQFQN